MFWNDSPPPVVEDDADDTDDELEFPPGLVGGLATYFYESAVRPVPEIALTGALTLTAGIVGRLFNISGMGLNVYVMLTAKTGRGKGGVEDGTDRVLAKVRPTVPMVDQFLGPGSIASGQAIHRFLNRHPSVVCHLGEFGITLQQICDPRASEVQLGLKKALLHCYGKSGRGKYLRSSAYAKSEDGIEPVESPALTLSCEGTPETFYAALSEPLIAQGLVSRFLVIDYDGPRPPHNKNNPPPNAHLVNHLTDIVTSALSMEQTKPIRIVDVTLSEEAERGLDEFNEYCDAKINSSAAVESELYNRAYANALKLAALVAVGCNHDNPIVASDHAEWAIKVVQRSVHSVLRRFERGEVGGNSANKAEAEVIKRIVFFLRMTPDERSHNRYGIAEGFRGRDCPVVPYNYLRKRLIDVTPFKDNRSLLDQVLAQMVKAEVLVLLPKEQAWRTWQTRGPVYGVGPNWRTI